MRRDALELARVFAEAYGASLDEARVAAALEAVFDADRQRAITPGVNEIRNRRIENVTRPIFATVERETGFSREELVAPGKARPLVAARDVLVSRLREARLSVRAVAAVANLSRRDVDRALARHAARVGARTAAPAIAVRSVR